MATENKDNNKIARDNSADMLESDELLDLDLPLAEPDPLLDVELGELQVEHDPEKLRELDDLIDSFEQLEPLTFASNATDISPDDADYNNKHTDNTEPPSTGVHAADSTAEAAAQAAEEAALAAEKRATAATNALKAAEAAKEKAAAGAALAAQAKADADAKAHEEALAAEQAAELAAAERITQARAAEEAEAAAQAKAIAESKAAEDEHAAEEARKIAEAKAREEAAAIAQAEAAEEAQRAAENKARQEAEAAALAKQQAEQEAAAEAAAAAAAAAAAEAEAQAMAEAQAAAEAKAQAENRLMEARAAAKAQAAMEAQAAAEAQAIIEAQATAEAQAAVEIQTAADASAEIKTQPITDAATEQSMGLSLDELIEEELQQPDQQKQSNQQSTEATAGELEDELQDLETEPDTLHELSHALQDLEEAAPPPSADHIDGSNQAALQTEPDQQSHEQTNQQTDQLPASHFEPSTLTHEHAAASSSPAEGNTGSRPLMYSLLSLALLLAASAVWLGLDASQQAEHLAAAPKQLQQQIDQLEQHQQKQNTLLLEQIDKLQQQVEVLSKVVANKTAQRWRSSISAEPAPEADNAEPLIEMANSAAMTAAPEPAPQPVKKAAPAPQTTAAVRKQAVKKALPATTRKSVTGKKTWVVVIESVRTKRKAAALLNKLKSMDILAESVLVSVQGKNWHRIQVTGFPTEHAAITFKQSLKADHQMNSWHYATVVRKAASKRTQAHVAAKQASPVTSATGALKHRYWFEAVGSPVWLQIYSSNADNTAKGGKLKEVLLQPSHHLSIRNSATTLWITTGNAPALLIKADGKIIAGKGTLGNGKPVLRNYKFSIAE